MMSPKGIFAEQPPGVAPTSIKRLARIAGVFYLIVGIGRAVPARMEWKGVAVGIIGQSSG